MRTRNIEIIKYINDFDDLIYKCNSLGIEYAYILHDKDIEEKTGEIKKAHYHFRVFGNNQKTISAWAKFFDVKENEVQVLDNKKRAIRYLVHIDSPKKYQYNIEDIITNIKDIDVYFEDSKQDEYLQLREICKYLDNSRGYIYFYDVKNFILQNNYWSAYRRYYSIIRDIIIEKNKYCIDYMLNG